MQPLPIARKWILYPLILFVILSIATPVLAEYTGPNRTVEGTVCKIILNECQYVESKDEYRYKSAGSWSCSNEDKPWQAYPGDPPRACSSSAIGEQYWSREDVSDTITYPPATISSTLQNCTLQNGWCITPPQLVLTGSEPVPGYHIYAIEGVRNVQNFGCTASSCNVPLIEGINSFWFWSLSSFGDTSEVGTFSAKVDSQPPTITGTFSGNAGANGWYLSSLSFNGSAVDGSSGLASFTCSLDGVALGSCNSITVSSPGPHTLVLTARDNAGLVRVVNQGASIDTQNPLLNASISGTLGSNSWYTAAVLNASASDPAPGSGLSLFEYRLDGGSWVSFPGSGKLSLMEGKHTVDLRALDKAGRTVTSSKSFWLDTVSPAAALDAAGTMGLNNWYTTDITLTASASDGTSGMDILEYRLDSGEWQAYASSLILADGTHSISLWAQDAAGLVTQLDRDYQVDTRAPQIGGSLAGTPGMNGWYVTPLTITASASDPAPGSGIAALTYTLDNSTEIPYNAPLTLSDGSHALRFSARDQAGLTHSIDQSFKVDTVEPSLTIETAPPAWVRGSLNLSGTANDSGSGLSSVELSLDGGQSWQSVTGADAWQYSWDTSSIPSGAHQVYVRAADLAGLTTQEMLSVNLDNQAPEISLPDSWFQWDTVTLNIADGHSGLAKARIEVIDPQGRWPRRVIELDPDQFPMSFKWDRRFDADTIAERGTYEVKVITSDRVGNTSEKSASINIPLAILPAGPTSTQPYIRLEPSPTATAVVTATPSSIPAGAKPPTVTKTPIVSVFGAIDPPPAQVTSTPAASPTPRSTPTKTGVQDWLESFFVPEPTVQTVTEIEPVEQMPAPPQSAGTDSPSILWGVAATAAIGAATAYAQEEKRKREEELARLKKLEEREEERRQKTKERQMEKLERKWAQEEAWEQARNEPWNSRHIDAKVERFEEEETAVWVASREEVKKKYEERQREKEEKKRQEEEKKKAEEVQAGLEAYYAAMRQGEEEAQPEPNWWEKTKSFVNDKIVEPVNTYVNTQIYEPYVKPLEDKIAEEVEKGISWVDRNIYQPHIVPAIENSKKMIEEETKWINQHVYEPLVKPVLTKANETVSKVTTWANEKVYQPYIKPTIEKTKEKVSQGMDWLNKNVYQPYIQPAVSVIDEKVYQPYIAPAVENTKKMIEQETEWIKENIYEPILAPVVDDIKENVLQPISNKLAPWWNEYGEWVHSALDIVGFLPVFGEAADLINGLIYLAEGRYVEAGLSVVSMIPLLGDMGKVGKWTANLGEGLVDKVVQGVAGGAIDKAAKELAEEGLEKLAKEGAGSSTVLDWAHQGLDIVGCIPGAGTATTNIKTLLHLANGKPIEAVLNAASMLPVVGDFIPLGREFAENSFNRLVKNSAEELTGKTVKGPFQDTLLGKTIKKTRKEMREDAIADKFKDDDSAAEVTPVQETPQPVDKDPQKVIEEADSKPIETTDGTVINPPVVAAPKDPPKDTSPDKVTDKAPDTDMTVTPDTDVNEAVDGTPTPVADQNADIVSPIREEYGDEAANLVQKYGEDAADLINTHGDVAIDLLNAVEPQQAQKLLENLDKDVLDSVAKKEPEAIDALSRWSEKELSEQGASLAMRAEKDAQVIADVEKLVALGPIDPKNLTPEQKALIDSIAANCTQNPGAQQIVLGKWVDISSGFVEHAQETGSVHYNPHPDMWDLLGGLENRDEVAWLVNQKVVQTGINNGLRFEYSLNGIPNKDLIKEKLAVEAVFSGAPNAEVIETLGSDYLPIRIKELQELHQAGYELSYDETNDSYLLIRSQKGTLK